MSWEFIYRCSENLFTVGFELADGKFEQPSGLAPPFKQLLRSGARSGHFIFEEDRHVTVLKALAFSGRTIREGAAFGLTILLYVIRVIDDPIDLAVIGYLLCWLFPVDQISSPAA